MVDHGGEARAERGRALRERDKARAQRGDLHDALQLRAEPRQTFCPPLQQAAMEETLNKLATEHTAVDEAGSTKSKLQIRKLDEVDYAYHSPMHKLVWCENRRNRVTISPMSAHRIHMGHSY